MIILNNMSNLVLTKINTSSIPKFYKRICRGDLKDPNLFDNVEINFKELIIIASEKMNHELVIRILSENRVKLETEKEIIDMIYNNFYSFEILNWLIQNKMNLNHLIVDIDDIIEEYDDIGAALQYGAYGPTNYVSDEFTDLTLEKFLVGVAIFHEDPELLDWILSFTEERSTEIINMLSFWWDKELIIPLFEKGFTFNELTAEKAIRGGNLEMFKYLMESGCKYNVTYESCDLAYEYDRPEMLKYLLSPESGFGFDNRYIIKTVEDKRNILFAELQDYYPHIEDYVFTGENSDLLNSRLKNYIMDYENLNTPQKRRRLVHIRN